MAVVYKNFERTQSMKMGSRKEDSSPQKKKDVVLNIVAAVEMNSQKRE